MIKKIFVGILISVLVIPSIALADPRDDKKDYSDVILTSLSPAINNAISGYYGHPRLYGLYDAEVLNIERVTEGQYSFEVTVKVKTFVGPHNPPFGFETITIAISPGSMLVTKFHHQNEN